MTSDDSGQGRPLKRARSDSATAQKHEDFYILDGNTVIEVDGVLFKLHRSRLVTKSSFFAQLLEHNLEDNVPNNDDAWMENEVTVYHLDNITTADDLVALLKFDDNPTEYYFQPPPFSVLAPILRAATALRFETYRVWAAQVLGQTWSSSLADLTPEPMENAAEFVVLARSCKVNTSSSWNKKAKSSASQETCSSEYGTQDAWDKRIHNSGLYTKFLFDPVCGAQALIDIPWGEEGWCSYCIRSKRTTWRKIREKLWSDMDKWILGHE
ncbi:hypothetical protein BDR03DRAFT_1086811 [Suillus americanus]|nr:hypothetical protein BDR03DRAFT_1086811 [Suillus americanus]